MARRNERDEGIWKSLRWWIAALAAVLLLVVYAVISTHTQSARTARSSSAYSMTRKDSAAITDMVRRSVIDCGDWGTTGITKADASDFYANGREVALNSARPDAKWANDVVSRHDKRQGCLYQYVASDSEMRNDAIDYTDRDAMMSYSVDDPSVTVSSPMNSQVVVNKNSKTSVTVKVSWTSRESGLYPIFKALPYDGGGYEYDNAIDANTQWGDFTLERGLSNVSFDVEKDGESWLITDIHGGDWDKYGYVNALADKVSLADGAQRAETPWEQNPGGAR